MDDNEKAGRLKEESLVQQKAAEGVGEFIKDAGTLIEANADEAKQIAARIEAISELTEQLKLELAPFKGTLSPEEAD
jgi:methyl-accepting chemotaxis protein